MNLKTKIILSRGITFLLGLVCIALGVIKDAESFTFLGVALLIGSILAFVKQFKALTNPEKMKELENTYNDERVLFIARKSYSFAFWISVYAEFAAVLVTLYIGLEDISTILSIVVCFQVLIYVVANMFYNKKY